MRAASAARNPVACCDAAAAAVPARSGTSRRNHFMALNIRLITFPFVSEFVFGTHNAAFVQVMYEQYLRDPASVGEEWRKLFDNGAFADLPVIATSREEVAGSGPRDPVPGMHAQAPSPGPRTPGPGLTPITGPAARLAQNMTDSPSLPTATA